MQSEKSTIEEAQESITTVLSEYKAELVREKRELLTLLRKTTNIKEVAATSLRLREVEEEIRNLANSEQFDFIV